MIKTQQGAFEIRAKDYRLQGLYIYFKDMYKNKCRLGMILLLATDSSGKVKAYADITALKDQIKAPFAMLLTENTNYTNPEQGSAPGTIKIMLNVHWHYKKLVAKH